MEIPIVNEKDEIICYKERDSEEQMDLYRISALWLTNSKKDILLAKRAFTKLHSPGVWGPAVAGTNDKGETYESNIAKETMEELGLKLDFNKSIKILRNSKDKPHNFFCQWFTATTDIEAKDIIFDKVEVAEVKWFSKEELIKEIKKHPDDFLITVKEFINGKINFDKQIN